MALKDTSGLDVLPDLAARPHPMELRSTDFSFTLDSVRDFEFEENDSKDTTFELYSILNNRKFWYKNLVMPKIVWESLRGGLDFWQFVDPALTIPKGFLKNNISSLNECDFVEKAICDLLKSGVIKSVDYEPHCVNPLTVSYSKGKKRLCLDLSRLVNPFLSKKKFKLDGLPTLSETFGTGFWFFSFDIRR